MGNHSDVLYQGRKKDKRFVKGVCYHKDFNTEMKILEKDLETIAEIGNGDKVVLRTDFWLNDMVDPEKRKQYHKVLSYAKSLNLEVVGILSHCWDPLAGISDTRNLNIWGDTDFNDVPEYMKEREGEFPYHFSSLVFEVVHEFKGYLNKWQIGNEKNHYIFRKKWKYAGLDEIFEGAARKAREADENAELILNAATDIGFSIGDFVGWKTFFKRYSKYFDTLAIDRYPTVYFQYVPCLSHRKKARWAAQILDRTVEEAKEFSKPIMIAETGTYKIGDEKLRESYLIEACEVAKKHDVPLCWYYFEDDEFNRGFGLIDKDGKKKPAFYAYKNFPTQ